MAVSDEKVETNVGSLKQIFGMFIGDLGESVSRISSVYNVCK